MNLGKQLRELDVLLEPAVPEPESAGPTSDRELEPSQAPAGSSDPELRTDDGVRVRLTLGGVDRKA